MQKKKGRRGPESWTNKVKRRDFVLQLLRRYYPRAECALNFETPFQLLIATILSAQCTDERVNQVTAVLFDLFPGPEDLAVGDLSQIELIVRPTGFFKNKAKSIIGTAQAIVQQHGGEVPQDVVALQELPGVGKKTANVVLGTAYGIPSGVVVDTHVGRLSRRLGFTKAQEPLRVEADLQRLLDMSDWIEYSHLLIHHGRQICKSRKPQCDRCFLFDHCPRVV